MLNNPTKKKHKKLPSFDNQLFLKGSGDSNSGEEEEERSQAFSQRMREPFMPRVNPPSSHTSLANLPIR
jgi:hypothetical protein